MAGLMLASCGGPGNPEARTPNPHRADATAVERSWRRQVGRFAAGVESELARLRASTGGSPGQGPVGRRLDPSVRAAGPRRRSLVRVLTALERCPARLADVMPEARLEPVREALANACTAFSSAAKSLAGALRTSPAPKGTGAGSLALARGQADEGVRLVVDALATLARVMPSRTG